MARPFSISRANWSAKRPRRPCRSTSGTIPKACAIETPTSASIPDVWRHGDYVLIHGDTGGVTFYGRSDAVLKPSGVRIGTAEIYTQLEKLDEIADSLAIGQNWQDDQRVVLFVKLAPGSALTDELKDKIRRTLRENASPRHVPSVILETPDIPYTLNMKKVESAVTNILNGRPVANQDALINPASLDYYRQAARELQVSSGEPI